MLKLLLLNFARMFLSLLRVLPLRKDQYFFLSYQGEQFSCNPFYIYSFLDENKKGKIFVWGLNFKKNITSHNNKVVIVKPRTLKYYIEIITSKYVVTNIQLPTYIPKKKDAIWINTWHGGGAFKLVENPSVDIYTTITKKIQSKNIDFYISSSKKFTEIMSKSTSIPISKFKEIGMPRNDIFFLPQEKKNMVRNKVCNILNIDKEKLIVLYAPTYRGDVSSATFNMELDLNKLKLNLEKKFMKSVAIIVRVHHTLRKKFSDVPNVIDGSEYTDMQELLVSSDVLLSDYSSCIYDYSLSLKPGFLFVPDLKMYEEQRGLYTSITEWPFDYAENNDELEKIIVNYDYSKSKKKIRDYLSALGACDTGNATKTIVNTMDEE